MLQYPHRSVAARTGWGPMMKSEMRRGSPHDQRETSALNWAKTGYCSSSWSGPSPSLTPVASGHSITPAREAATGAPRIRYCKRCSFAGRPGTDCAERGSTEPSGTGFSNRTWQCRRFGSLDQFIIGSEPERDTATGYSLRCYQILTTPKPF